MMIEGDKKYILKIVLDTFLLHTYFDNKNYLSF